MRILQSTFNLQLITILVVTLHTQVGFCSENNPIISILFTSDNNKYAKILTQTLLQEPTTVLVDVISIDMTNNICSNHLTKATKNSSLIITLGEDSLKKTLQCTGSIPILSSLLYKTTFEKNLSNHNKNPERKISALYFEQPLSRQLSFIESIAQQNYDHLSLGVVAGPTSSQFIVELNSLANNKNIPVKTIFIETAQNTITAFQEILQHCNFVLALPDPIIFNQQTGHGMLLTASRHGIPVIAYSNAYVQSGALAAIYSTKQQYALELTSLAMEFLQNPDSSPPPALRHPELFSIAINQGVADTLGIRIKTEYKIK